MKRPITLEQAFAYLDGQLSPESMEHLHAIVETCEQSARIMTEARKARSVWQQAAAQDLDDLTWKRIDNAVNNRIAQESIQSAAALPFNQRFHSWIRATVWAVVGAACALFIYINVGLPPIPLPENTALPIAPIVSVKASPQVGDVLTTGTESRHVQIAAAKLTMEPASVVRVATQSPTGTVLELVAGKVDFNVAPRKKGRIFQVRAGDVSVTVKGTQFSVERTTEGTVHVSVTHGLVSVQRNNEPETLLAAGEHLSRSAVAMDAPPTRTVTPVAVDTTIPNTASEQTGPIATALPTPERKTKSQSRVRVKAKKSRIARTASAAVQKTQPLVEKKAVQPANIDPTVRVIEINVEEPNVTYVEMESEESNPRQTLKSILRGIGTASYGTTIQQLRAWKKEHSSHRLQMTAQYAIGYCEFKRGNRIKAKRIFAQLPDNNRWIRTAADFDNPQQPR